MCTLVVLHRVHPELPVVLAANRDELFARQTEGPQILVDDPRVVGGRDVVAGGTWLGLTPSGFFVAVTNEAGAAPRPGLRSRGALVMDMLREGGTAAAESWLRAREPARYNPFNLMFGDAGGLRVAYARGGQLEVDDVPQGVHVLPNGRLDSPHFGKVAHIQGLLADPATVWAGLLGQLRGALADDLVCVRTPFYGTRSSSVIALRQGSVAVYLHADGPADEAPFEDHAWLLS